ncbi:2-hydroxy-6-oxo-6-phenylhexa-2,4-dienoate hydrolase [Trabulsiella guamensis ATCC 49490]|uniref:2-hydroxy-6-oxo-6-phenylhexa-2,4-dienoate hydrolase n=1 Tax=Trabulsiella guamensis ATCC 49490 TaxID=1005994 RepID=A0A085A8M9_9ENTR|nr:alpha/beta hydrolase [Trabulsiella guamensis]KFC06574.1 2-hydroxy-6-oxo-6-phenylhexa-2,4-dienoate hydrolase [Trabulsiella guamensis ATCC 49490]
MDSFFSPTAKCRVRWQDLPGSGVPLIFVHGLGCASSCEYPRVVVDKAFGGKRAILLDLPGCGYSEKPRDYSYSISEQAIVVAELVAQDDSPWAGSLAVDAPWAVWRGAASLVAGNDWFTRFVDLPKPKQLIFGEHSLPDDDFSRLDALGIPTVVLPGCGHLMSWENPTALAAALTAFCN